MNLPNRPIRQRLLPILIAAGGLTGGISQAADAPAFVAPSPATSAGVPSPRSGVPARPAFDTLLASLPGPAPAGEAPPRRQVQARRGETVDAAIRRTMGDLPFKEAFLRGVFLEVNASVIQPGTLRLVPGAQFQVPTVVDLRHHLERMLAPAPPAEPREGAAAPSDTGRRQWVRFP